MKNWALFEETFQAEADRILTEADPLRFACPNGPFLMRGMLSGPSRIIRHLWRMCTAIFIDAALCDRCLSATGSLKGQG